MTVWTLAMTLLDFGDGMNAFWRIWSGWGSIHTTHTHTHTHTYACVDLEHGTLAIARRRLVHDMPRKWKRHMETCVFLQPVCKSFVD